MSLPDKFPSLFQAGEGLLLVGIKFAIVGIKFAIVTARVVASSGNLAEAKSSLETILKDEIKRGYLAYQFETRLALVEIDPSQDTPELAGLRSTLSSTMPKRGASASLPEKQRSCKIPLRLRLRLHAGILAADPTMGTNRGSTPEGLTTGPCTWNILPQCVRGS